MGAGSDRRDARDAAFGSRLLNPLDHSGDQLATRVQLLLTTAIVIANVVGEVAVVTIATVLHGGVQRFEEAGVLVLDIILVPTYAVLALVGGVTWGTIRIRRQLQWVRDDRPPGPDDQRAALRAPIELTRIQGVLWGLGALFFSVLNGIADPELGLEVLLHVVIGGAVVGAVTYLLAEFIMRPIAARALAVDVPDRLHVPGITARQLLAWSLGALPIVGLMTVGLSALIRRDLDRTQLAVAILVLCGVTLVVGALLALLAARATSDPVQDLRAAMADLDEGVLDAEVTVYDGTEIGLLQAGFNRAVAGLRERERLRDLFGRHVGEEVARAALAEGPRLGGEEVEVAILFVDVIGSTELAATRPPREVVAVLNTFFSVVVDVVDQHGGYVNKFAGDAVLAVWGAPVPHPDPAGSALRAARAMARRLDAEVAACAAGIGVAAGRAVAGNVGHPRRLEYTVVGDAVNEAARLSERAKGLPGRVAASMRAVETADGRAGDWTAQAEVELRGRPTATRIAVPTGEV